MGTEQCETHTCRCLVVDDGSLGWIPYGMYILSVMEPGVSIMAPTLYVYFLSSSWSVSTGLLFCFTGIFSNPFCSDICKYFVQRMHVGTQDHTIYVHS